MIDVSLEQLLEVGAHFGHQSKRWNPKMAPYIFGVKEGVHVFDLVKTRELLLEALEALRDASAKNKTILFVGTKKQAKYKVAEVAKACNQPFVTERWLGGTLTNFGQLMASVRKLNDLKEKLSTDSLTGFTKKEKLLMSRKVDRMEKSVGGLSDLNKKPDLIVIIDTHKEKGATREAFTVGIPTIGVVDTNSDPNGVTYPIPMNDDASKSLEYVLSLFQGAVLEGKNGPKKEEKVDAKSEVKKDTKKVVKAKGKTKKEAKKEVEKKDVKDKS